MSKNSERARVEKNLEDMMGNDWREFRAKLVAKEKHDLEEENKNEESSCKEDSNNIHDEKRAKQDKIGNIFAAIFQQNHAEEEKKKYSKKVAPSIFEGNTIGGSAKDFIIPSCEDPFVSAAEIPVLMEPKVNLDKHRWAHPISHVEPGCVLVANEKLGGVFHQTVVLVIEHNESKGSTGIVINRPLSGNLSKIVSETESNVDLSLKMAFNSAKVTFGGPVMQEEYSILHGYGEVEGSKKVAPGIFVGGSEALMNEVRKGNFHPDEALFVKGHAAWVPSQLSREVSKGVWYIASCSNDLILRYAGAPLCQEDNSNDLWSDILTCMGGQYPKIAEQHTGKGDQRMMP
eukprot:CAMPEP_0184857712 /NCGR_PEP_ID=MMETSP0580-20130426/2860_1 /TAXON_ID=1118495 /ORGANISM="Dactyliosolen fragilissimus" /LENGTH=344 /DNA_ID=CAMNT_0027353461 /DNA_START=438 /DNA_END=1472 /DNA_ORIENTATION=-